MDTLRTYGPPPYRVAVIHGGPGAGGEMAPVARELASGRSVLEPIQTARTLEGQVAELRAVLRAHADPPVMLIGYSWGAWLSFILAARYPALVEKLILVGSGPFEERYVSELKERRFGRLTEQEQAEFEALLEALGDREHRDRDALLARLGALALKTDAYDPLAEEPEPADRVDTHGDVFQGVWGTAAQMRRSGELLELGRHIACPVVAIHGAYDPHPAEGVEVPLARVVDDFRFVLLAHCGHTPWMERQARERFYEVVEEELE